MLTFIALETQAQNYSFNFNTSGRRVCPVTTQISLNAPSVKIIFHDSTANTAENLSVHKRLLGTFNWSAVTTVSAGTGHWIDTNVKVGDVWEYQVRRQNTWTYKSASYDAIGYTIGALLPDNTDYKGQMILLVSNDIPLDMPARYERLKKEITNDGWFVNELIVPKDSGWDGGSSVVSIKNQITSIYTGAPITDKPKVLFIFGHVPLPRCGSTNIISPDDHIENTGARGCDAYYADIDGVFTDTATYNPGGLSTNLAINLPNDFKWDQEFIPSGLEMAFGRIDFEDITDISTSEKFLLQNYLDRLSAYRNVTSGHDMGRKSAFFFGYDNSNDASYRNLLNISSSSEVYQNYNGPNHNSWVKANGPFKIYMQNIVVPEINDWLTFGMDATVYASDQSYWGFGDVPQPNSTFSRIRSLLAVSNSKCLATIWTTTGLNIFHQACTGEALGVSMKTIMNHNPSNLYLEKPAQEYDEQDWWNRTHFAFYGDPTINLYQIAPPANPVIMDSNNIAVLSWGPSADTTLLGYHVYESTSELGKFNRITSNPISTKTFAISNYQKGNWYMVKAVKVIESGCGKLIHASMGVSTEGKNFIGIDEHSLESALKVYPNPTKGLINITGDKKIVRVKVSSLNGSIILQLNPNSSELIIDLSELAAGIYTIESEDQDGQFSFSKVIITN